jgi:hypothetical protein
MFEGVSKKIGTKAQEKHGQEADQTSERSRQPSANDQGLDGVVRGNADKSFCAHGSALAGALSYGDGIFDAQKLEIREVGRGVFLLQRRAADAARIRTVYFTV